LTSLEWVTASPAPALRRRTGIRLCAGHATQLITNLVGFGQKCSANKFSSQRNYDSTFIGLGIDFIPFDIENTQRSELPLGTFLDAYFVFESKQTTISFPPPSPYPHPFLPLKKGGKDGSEFSRSVSL